MKCQKFKKLLPEYLYGELAPAAREEAQDHAASCPACRRLLEEMTETVSLLESGPRSHFSGAEMAALRMRVKEEAGRPVGAASPVSVRRRLFSRPILLPVAGALAAAAVAAAVLIMRQPAVPPPSGVPIPSGEAGDLVAMSETVEEEFQELAEVCGEIEDLQSPFLDEANPVPEAETPSPAVSAAV
ncbi:MAG: zf-HC2 domain-containing protein [PVC group bacterium]